MSIQNTFKVVDSNYLRKPERLLKYLNERDTNFVVLIDYIGMEMYKGNPIRAVPLSMKHLCEFPERAVILKATEDEICRLSGRPEGLRQRMICSAQMEKFPHWCASLKGRPIESDPVIERELIDMGHDARQYLAHISAQLAPFRMIVKQIEKSYDKKDVLCFWKGEITAGLKQICIPRIFETWHAYSHTLGVPIEITDASEALNLFLFRRSLMTHVLVLHWIEKRGVECRSEGELLNDFIDVNVATYGTYFDGILAKDWIMERVFPKGSALLKEIATTSGYGIRG